MDNFLPDVDGQPGRSFFRAQPVDDISAGSNGRACESFGTVPSGIPSLHTEPAACLHRVSTGLCTPRLDAGGGSQKTVRTTGYNLRWPRVPDPGEGP